MALNVVVMNDELARLEKILKIAESVKVDAIVAWDMAVLNLAKQRSD